MKKYKSKYYSPRSKYIYLVYNSDEIEIGEYFSCIEIEKKLGLKRNSINITFCRKKTNEIKFKKYYIYRNRPKNFINNCGE